MRNPMSSLLNQNDSLRNIHDIWYNDIQELLIRWGHRWDNDTFKECFDRGFALANDLLLALQAHQ